MVDRVARLCLANRLVAGQGGALGRDERPVVLPLGALLDPASDQLLFAVVERTPRVGRWHVVVRIIGGDAPVNFALARLASNEWAHAVLVAERARRGVEPQTGLALVGVWPVTLVTVVGEDRADVPAKIDRVVVSPGRGVNGRKQAGEQDCHRQRAPGRLAAPSHYGVALGALVADGLTGAGGRSSIFSSSIPRDG